jgi:cyanate permease
VGPYFFSLMRDVTGSYAAPAIGCGIIAALLFIGAFWADRPAPPDRAAP